MGVSISGFLLVFTRMLLFVRKSRKTALSIKVTRSISRPVVRQGMRLQVDVQVDIRVSDHISVRYHEICPDTCGRDPEIPATGILSAGVYSYKLQYVVIPLMHGSIQFPGGNLIVSDLFFEMNLPMTGQDYSGPVLMVQPYPLFRRTGPDGDARELERVGSVQGFGVRSMREYLPGDDLRYVDWKMSAKRGKLFIREYSTQEEGQPMLIVDLPDREQPYDSDGFLQLVGVVCGVIESTLAMKKPISLLLISGPNFPAISYEGRDLAGFMTVLRKQLHPQVRLHHLYRRQSRLSLRTRSRQWHSYSVIEGNDSEGGNEFSFISRMTQISGRHLLHGGVSIFQERMARFLGRTRIRDLTLYSLCEGDVSHIRDIAALAHQRNIRFRVLTPIAGDILREDAIRQELRGISVGGV